MRILVADDDPESRRWLIRALGVLGHAADAVEDAEALIRRAAELDPDVVLSDIGLPGRDGIDAGISLRDGGARCRIVLMSGSPESVERARRAGFARVLGKPFTLGQLAGALS